MNYKFEFGKGFNPGSGQIYGVSFFQKHNPQTNKMPSQDNETTILQDLRQLQRDLGVMDNSGNLFDPVHEQWVSRACMPFDEMKHIENLYNDLNYFETYPHLKNGLSVYLESKSSKPV